MKKLMFFFALIIIVFTATVNAQTKLITETTVIYDKLQKGVPLNRVELKDPYYNVKYDYKTDLINNRNVNDVFGIYFPKVVVGKSFTLGAGFIGIGDWKNSDQLVAYLHGTKKVGSTNLDLEVGRAIGYEIKPWDYIMGRISKKNFTVEGAIISPDRMLSSSRKKLYGWIAYHPEHLFVAVANETCRNWFYAGTKKYKDFGTFAFANYDRSNGNFWFRSQTGYKEVNQKFFDQNNYIVATSYLSIPLFFYMHFGPMSTKGKYAFKVDGKRVGKLENYEISFGRQYGKYGQVAVGLTTQNLPKRNSSILLEYYKEITLCKNFKASAELRYENLCSRLSGFITLSYQLPN